MGKVQFSAHFDPLAKDLLKRLLVSDRTRRLGNLKVFLNIDTIIRYTRIIFTQFDRVDQKM
jgi:hypothetical protein